MNALREVKEAENSNNTLQLSQVAKIYPQYEVVTEGKYFPYNFIYEDDKWGCAWRAIQLMLSAHGVEGCEDFKELFQKYAHKKELMSIIEEKTKFKGLPRDKLKQVKWAPEENNKNWAEPFIGQIICEKYNLQTELFHVNGHHQSCYAPEEFFSFTSSFQNFWKIIKDTIPFSPLMIDDGTIALSIVGYFEEAEDKLHIVLADPHINSNRQIGSVGIYEVILDEKGKRLKSIFPDEGSSQKYRKTYELIDFEEKKWMVLRVMKQS